MGLPNNLGLLPGEGCSRLVLQVVDGSVGDSFEGVIKQDSGLGSGMGAAGKDLRDGVTAAKLIVELEPGPRNLHGDGKGPDGGDLDGGDLEDSTRGPPVENVDTRRINLRPKLSQVLGHSTLSP